MSHDHRQKPEPLNTARSDATKAPLQEIPLTGDVPGPIDPPTQALAEDDTFMHRIAPCRQKNARAYLQGKSPGVMQSYAPDAATSSTEGFVEDDDTVHRLVRWREEAIQ